MAERTYQLPDPVTGKWVTVTKAQFDAAHNAAQSGSPSGGSTNSTRTAAPVAPPARTWSPPPATGIGGGTRSSSSSFGGFGSQATPGFGTSAFGEGGMLEDDGGSWIGDVGGWLAKQLSGIDAGDVLGAAGAGVGAYMDSKTAAAALAQREREFQRQLAQRQAEMGMSGEQFEKTLGQRQAEEATRSGEFGRTTGNTEAQIAVQAETAMNKAPMADKAQALLLARMGAAPQSFQPRDITRGIPQFRAGASGGPSNVTATMQNAASSYKPGAGGVDTTALKLLQQRMLAGKQQNPGVAGPPEQPPRVPGVGEPRVRRPRFGIEPIVPEESPITVPQVRAPRPAPRPYY